MSTTFYYNPPVMQRRCFRCGHLGLEHRWPDDYFAPKGVLPEEPRRTKPSPLEFVCNSCSCPAFVFDGGAR